MDLILYSQILFFATLFIFFVMWKKYGVRMILHPFSVFLVTWLPTFIAIPLFSVMDSSAFLFNESAVKTLLSFYLFNLFTIYISFFIYRVDAKRKLLDINIIAPKQLYNGLVLLLFVVNIIRISLAGFSADISANREMEVDIAIQINQTGRASLFYSITSIVNSLLTPLMIISARNILSKLMYRGKYNLSFFDVIPFSIIVTNTVIGGGRAGIISAFILLIFGVMLFYNYQVPFRIFAKKAILAVFVILSVFSLYSTYVADQRAERRGRTNYVYVIQNEKLMFLNGVIEYSFWHVLGFQYRMLDTFSDKPDGLEGNTFGFFKNLTLPFASQFGMNNNLGSILGIKDAKKIKVDKAENITATVYFNLYDDLGYVGTLIAILIFTFFTQYLFKWLILSKIRHVISLAFYIFVFNLWRSSWFHHVVGSINFVSLYVPYVIYELLVKFFYQKVKR